MLHFASIDNGSSFWRLYMVCNLLLLIIQVLSFVPVQ